MGTKDKAGWHFGFYAAIQIEFMEYWDGLQFTDEFQLTKGPLKMDVLIVKKAPELEIQKDIGRIFLEHNVIEYKSWKDYLSIRNFYKGLGYAALYISHGYAGPGDVTLTFVTRRYPRKLFGYLRADLGCEVEEVFDGIYYIRGFGGVPIQVIETKKLDEEENFRIKALVGDSNARPVAERILAEYWEHNTEEIYNTYLNVLMSANKMIFEEVARMASKKEMAEVFDRLIAEGDNALAELLKEHTEAYRQEIENLRQRLAKYETVTS